MKISTLKNVIIVFLVFASFLSGYFIAELKKPVNFSESYNEEFKTQMIYYNELQSANDFSAAFLELKTELGENYSDEFIINKLSEKYKNKVEILEKMKLYLNDNKKQIKL